MSCILISALQANQGQNSIMAGKHSHSASYGHHHSIRKVRSRPLYLVSRFDGACMFTHLLMCQNITPYLPLLPLHELDIRLHPILRKCFCKQITDIRIRVQSSQLKNTLAFLNRLLRELLTVMNWKTNPNLPNSHTYSFISFSPKPAASQLKLGLKLYANH